MNNTLNLIPFALAPRDKNEAHRAATPLELMFDLAAVIAIAVAAVGLHHALAEAHYVDHPQRGRRDYF